VCSINFPTTQQDLRNNLFIFCKQSIKIKIPIILLIHSLNI
jgi:hypothetical protein